MKVDDSNKNKIPEIIEENNNLETSVGSDTEENFVDCKSDEITEATVTVNESIDQTELLNNSESEKTSTTLSPPKEIASNENDCSGTSTNGVVSSETVDETPVSSEAVDETPVSSKTVGETKEPSEVVVETREASGETSSTSTPSKSPKNFSMQKQHYQRSPNRSRALTTSPTVIDDEYSLRILRKQRIYYLSSKQTRKSIVPSDDCEVFCANIPINCLEDVLIPLFDRFGKIWNIRLQMKNRQLNAGFAFIRYTTADAAKEAIKTLNEYQIVPGKFLMIRRSSPNLSLFVGNIHRGLTKEQIHAKFDRLTTGLMNTIVKSSYYEESKNSGFCILEYNSNTSAYRAKMQLRRIKVWGRQLFVDWSQQSADSNSSDVKDSKTIFINCLPKGTTVDNLTEILSTCGEIGTITLIKDYAFVKFKSHESAALAVESMTGNDVGNETTTITMARKRATKFRRENRMHSFRNQIRRSRSYKAEERKANAGEVIGTKLKELNEIAGADIEQNNAEATDLNQNEIDSTAEAEKESPIVSLENIIEEKNVIDSNEETKPEEIEKETAEVAEIPTEN